MKILILFSYFNRPLLLNNALHSILRANKSHPDWELFFFDDNSPLPGEPIVKTILKDHLHKITFQRSSQTIQDKLENGLQLGKAANEMMERSSADVVITLADDDELVDSYLTNLSEYFTKNPDVMYCYSKVYVFNPLVKGSKKENIFGIYNNWGNQPINPVNKVDSSQVAFRLSCFKQYGIKYPESSKGKLPFIENFDADLFQQLFKQFGEAQPTNFIAQYKGIHDYQLVWNKKKNHQDLSRFLKKIEKLGGKNF